jgi:hypothetical protein
VQVNTEASLVPVVLGELDAQTELPLPRFLPHQQLFLVRLHLNHISFVKLESCLHSVVLLVGVGKCLAIFLQKVTSVANLVGFVKSMSTVLQTELIPFNHFPQSQPKTDRPTHLLHSEPQHTALFVYCTIHQCQNIFAPVFTGSSHVILIKLDFLTGKSEQNYPFCFFENLYNWFCFLAMAICSCPFKLLPCFT